MTARGFLAQSLVLLLAADAAARTAADAFQSVSAQEGEERRRWRSFQVEMSSMPAALIAVTLRDGSEISGARPVVFDDQIVIKVSSGERRVDRRTIRRVARITPGNRQKRVSLGALLGAAVVMPALGVGLGSLIGGVAGGVIGGVAGDGRTSVVLYEAPVALGSLTHAPR